MFPSPHMLDLLVYEFAGGGGGRLAFAQVDLGASDGCFLWHECSSAGFYYRCRLRAARWRGKYQFSWFFWQPADQAGSSPRGGVLDPWGVEVELRKRRAKAIERDWNQTGEEESMTVGPFEPGNDPQRAPGFMGMAFGDARLDHRKRRGLL